MLSRRFIVPLQSCFVFLKSKRLKQENILNATGLFDYMKEEMSYLSYVMESACIDKEDVTSKVLDYLKKKIGTFPYKELS